MRGTSIHTSLSLTWLTFIERSTPSLDTKVRCDRRRSNIVCWQTSAVVALDFIGIIAAASQFHTRWSGPYRLRGDPAAAARYVQAKQYIYTASKAFSNHLVRTWYKTYELPIIITNCSNNYGPRETCSHPLNLQYAAVHFDLAHALLPCHQFLIPV